jgi:ATP-dependent DNA helicase DinG
LLERLNSFPHAAIKSLCKLSAGLKSDIYMLFDEALQKKEQAVEELPHDIETFRGIALKRPFQLVETGEQTTFPDYPYSGPAKQKLLAKALPAFEARNGQFEMMDQIFGAFENGRHALIEAGTGIGKTLAYLVPAVFFSKTYRKTIVVSTFTTQLQHQLLVNDLPKLRAMFDSPIKAVLLKGRNHYINLARFEQSLKEEDDNYDTTLSKMQIIVWLTETETGDIDELNLSSGGMIYWNKIKNGESSFIQTKHWNAWDFYLRARKEAEDADLIITNHSMLLSDLNSEGSFLPPYKFAVLDEAHQFEKVAGRYFGKSFDYLSAWTV